MVVQKMISQNVMKLIKKTEKTCSINYECAGNEKS